MGCNTGHFSLRREKKSMITLDKSDVNEPLSFKGLSTDTKPTVKYKSLAITNGSTFFEMDTQDVYFYDGATDSWLPQP